ncbi:PIN domain-containing protein [Kitasatospora herbaricolor]|uniref:PIN domain-containing protein n=1 Tax=Kitasatospora herbaricolor TaxID=68217 RepID=UPI001748E5CE|nr:PIN domain-containing protein [Kitasatospora herbaricolor]MDQ0311329.1 putative nucleic acid-binding protein [Kitasatospora herbaricolor]GGV37038.1 PIN domain-containing protein [Kitasatospora herbaricolor]
MAFVVVYDACVLYPNTLRDLLIRVALRGLVRARWTDAILDEVDRNLLKDLEIPAEKLQRRRRLMNNAIRDCLVTGYEPLIDGLKLPDPDDRHVVAAAIRSSAQVIVTENRKDFPQHYLDTFGIERKSADDFIMDLIGLDDRVVYACVQEIALGRRNPAQTLDDVLAQLERSGLNQTVSALRLGRTEASD